MLLYKRNIQNYAGNGSEFESSGVNIFIQDRKIHCAGINKICFIICKFYNPNCQEIIKINLPRKPQTK